MADFFKIRQNFRGATLTIEKVEELQSSIEVKGNLIILKYDFSLKTVAPIFTPVALELLEQSNKTICVFPSFKLLSHSLHQLRVSRIRLKFRRQLLRLLKLEVRLCLEQRGSILHCCEDLYSEIGEAVYC